MSSDRTPGDDRRKRSLEMTLFVAVSAAGVFAMGNGLRALFRPGRGVDLGWLAVAGLAFWILCSQMGPGPRLMAPPGWSRAESASWGPGRKGGSTAKAGGAAGPGEGP